MSSREAAGSNSTAQAMTLQHGLEWKGFGFACAQCDQTLLSQLNVLKVSQMFQDGLARVEGLGAARGFGQRVQAGFDFGW